MKVAVIGMGYVGIQLAIEIGRHYETIGFDFDIKKLDAYKLGIDPTGEINRAQFDEATNLQFTNKHKNLRNCDIYIVAVPTPIDEAKNPDLESLADASKLVGEVMDKGAIVVYESTVYPGATEEVCVPILESASGLVWKIDFHIGYSPERINPGDPEHTLTRITKVVSADDENTLKVLVELYGGIVEAGLYEAPSIRVAEAAKVIENTQRDLNIALINELAIICDRLEINTSEVLETAGSKWNFLPFKPGLVGGHCIGVDPYYLTHKAQMVNYKPEVILAGRRLNDNMGQFIAAKAINLMHEAGLPLANTRVNVFGVTFKENCADIRNSQVLDLIRELQVFGLDVHAVDPLANISSMSTASDIELVPMEKLTPAPVGILAVPHNSLLSHGFSWIEELIEKPGLLLDVKSVYRREALACTELGYWAL